MTLDLLARLVVLLACAVAVGVLYVRLARPAPAPREPGVSRPLPGAVNAALGALVVVGGGAVVTGIGLAAGDGAALVLARLAGIALLAIAALLAVIPAARGRLGTPTLVGLAWLGAGLALAAPLVLLVAAVVIVLLAVRVTERPGG